MKVFDNPMKNLDFTISLIKTHRSELLRRELPQAFVSRVFFMCTVPVYGIYDMP